MAKAKLNLYKAETLRTKLTTEQEKKIRSLYEEAAKKVQAAANKIPKTPSDILRQQYLRVLKAQLDDEIKALGNSVSDLVQGSMREVSQEVVNASVEFVTSLGLPSEGAFSYVPNDIIESIVTGKLYGGKWSLSSAIWNSVSKTQKDIESVIAMGIAQNKSAYDIAKDLETYVSPSARKEWDWSKVYPGTNKKVDYNAQRLARTMVSHAYQQSFEKTTRYNPFVTGYRWLVSNAHGRVCELCLGRASQNDYGLGTGVYPKGSLPLDHPNGMCTFEAVFQDSMEDIAIRLADWAKGNSDKEIDRYIESMRGAA